MEFFKMHYCVIGSICYREEVTPGWIYFFYFNRCFRLLSFTKRVLSIHNGLPWRTLSPCLHVKTKWFCSEPCPPVDGYQFSSVSQLCPTLCDPMDCSMPGFLVLQQLLEFTQSHVHRIGDAIQLSHPLSSPSPAPNPSQHQSLFQ